MYSMNSFTTSAIAINCESRRDLPSTETGYHRRGQFPNVKGDLLLPSLFKLRFSSAFRDGIGVFKPISLLFMD